MARAAILLVICNLLGGLTYPWQKSALQGLPPATITALRTFLGLLGMAGWLAWRGGGLRWPFDRRQTRRVALLGSAGFAAPLLLGAFGVDRSTAVNGALLILLEPVSILVLSHLLLGERVGGTRAAGVALGLAGALCVVGEGLFDATLTTGTHLTGNLMLAASATLWALYTPLAAPLVKSHTPMQVAYGATLAALVLFVPAALLERGEWRGGPGLLPALGYTAALGVCGSFLGVLLWNVALVDLPAPVIAPFILLQPAVGVLAGVLQHGERVSAWAMTGAALAAAGVALVLFGEHRAPPPAPADCR